MHDRVIDEREVVLRFPGPASACHFARLISITFDEIAKLWPGIKAAHVKGEGAWMTQETFEQVAFHLFALPVRVLTPGRHLVRLPMSEAGTYRARQLLCPPEIIPLDEMMYLCTVKAPSDLSVVGLACDAETWAEIRPCLDREGWFWADWFSPRWLHWSCWIKGDGRLFLRVSTDGRVEVARIIELAFVKLSNVFKRAGTIIERGAFVSMG